MCVGEALERWRAETVPVLPPLSHITPHTPNHLLLSSCTHTITHSLCPTPWKTLTSAPVCRDHSHGKRKGWENKGWRGKIHPRISPCCCSARAVPQSCQSSGASLMHGHTQARRNAAPEIFRTASSLRLTAATWNDSKRGAGAEFCKWDDGVAKANTGEGNVSGCGWWDERRHSHRYSNYVNRARRHIKVWATNQCAGQVNTGTHTHTQLKHLTLMDTGQYFMRALHLSVSRWLLWKECYDSFRLKSMCEWAFRTI